MKIIYTHCAPLSNFLGNAIGKGSGITVKDTTTKRKNAFPSSYLHRQSQRKYSGTDALPNLRHDIFATVILVTYSQTSFSVQKNCHGIKHLYKLRSSPTLYILKLLSNQCTFWFTKWYISSYLLISFIFRMRAKSSQVLWRCEVVLQSFLFSINSRQHLLLHTLPFPLYLRLLKL